MPAEEECVEGYFREKDSKLQMSMEERVKSINERVEHISQKVEDVIQKETAHTAAYQVRSESAAARQRGNMSFFQQMQTPKLREPDRKPRGSR